MKVKNGNMRQPSSTTPYPIQWRWNSSKFKWRIKKLLLIELRESEIVNKTAVLSFYRANQKKIITEVEQLQQEVAGQKAIISVQESEVVANTSKIEALKSENAIKINEQYANMAGLAASKAALEKKETIIMSLNDQLTRTRQYISSKQQVIMDVICQ